MVVNRLWEGCILLELAVSLVVELIGTCQTVGRGASCPPPVRMSPLHNATRNSGDTCQAGGYLNGGRISVQEKKSICEGGHPI